MTGKKIIHTSEYDYANVVKRLKQAEERQKHQLPAKKAPIVRPARTYVRRAPVAAAPPKISLWTKIGRVARDETKQLTVAGLVMLGFAGWMVSTVQTYFDERAEAQLAQSCHENQLAHAGATVCFDDRRFVHTLNADGTTKKGTIDWRVNEAAHRIAEAAAAREARERAAAP